MTTPEARVEEINGVLEDLWHGVKIRRPYLTAIQREVRSLAGVDKKAPKGFTRNSANAFWLTCDACEDGELFFGFAAEVEGREWVTKHRKACKLSR